VKRILITGMSGTGKSTVIADLAARGQKAVDLDYGDYSLETTAADAATGRPGSDWRWDERRVTELLDTEDADVLFVGGTASNQSKFYARFDHIVLLTASDEVIASRMVNRTNNPYGKEPADVARQLSLKKVVEPWLRRAADIEIETGAPLDDVVAAILRLAD
jgi:shikimate kinase